MADLPDEHQVLSPENSVLNTKSLVPSSWGSVMCLLDKSWILRDSRIYVTILESPTGSMTAGSDKSRGGQLPPLPLPADAYGDPIGRVVAATD